MKQKFRDIRFSADSLDRIEQCNEIIEAYQEQGLKLTLRQLYYRLVAAAVIPNVERSYKNLSSLVSNGRLAGLIDWAAIEDRGRTADTPSEWETIADLVDTALSAYRLPRWDGQENYVELWVEKDALSGVLAPTARNYHVTLMVNKGYSSQSAMFESAERFIANNERRECAMTLLYLGDMDPSGEDMVRDIRSRLEMFGADITVKKIALTMEQIKRYNPPPNPTKKTDPRALAYVEKYGNSSWEVDALPPNILTQIIEDALDELVDRPMMDRIVKREKLDKERLRKAAEEILAREE